MEQRILRGDWEEVSSRHGDYLKGHEVEIRIVDGIANPDRSADVEWQRFLERVGRLTQGKSLPPGKVFRAEDFYESSD
jgi:hypothetical protein